MATWGLVGLGVWLVGTLFLLEIIANTLRGITEALKELVASLNRIEKAVDVLGPN
jgi:hypothetical protein